MQICPKTFDLRIIFAWWQENCRKNLDFICLFDFVRNYFAHISADSFAFEAKYKGDDSRNDNLLVVGIEQRVQLPEFFECAWVVSGGIQDAGVILQEGLELIPASVAEVRALNMHVERIFCVLQPAVDADFFGPDVLENLHVTKIGLETCA